MKKTASFGLISALFLTGIFGCGEYLAPFSGHDPGGQSEDGHGPQVQQEYADHVDGPRADHRAMHSITLADAAEARRYFSETEVARFHYPDAFRQVGIMIDAEDVESLEFRILRDDDSRGEWRPVDIFFSEGHIHNGLILTGEPMGAIELRGATGVSFAHLEFHEEVIARSELIRRTGPQPHLTGTQAMAEDDDLASLRQAVAPSSLVTSRHQWGAIDPDKICNSVVEPYRMTVHHTASPSGPSDDNAARMRGIQSFHINTRGWCDIGYHFVVGYDGEILQGRSRSNRPGAHVGAHNPGNVGISVIGTYTDSPVPQAQVEGVAAMVRWVHETHGVPLNRDVVRGHREWPDTATLCPGQGGLDILNEVLEIAGGEINPGEGYDVSLRIKVSGLDDFYQQGTSADLPDALAGDTFMAEIFVTNDSERPIRGVELGYAIETPALVATNYRIDTDAPLFDQTSWQVNDSDSAPGNPERQGLGQEGHLIMYAFAAGETKRVVLELEAGQYNIGLGHFSGLRAWVRNIDDLYAQQSFDADPSPNYLDAHLRQEARVDVVSGSQWQFRSGEPHDLEGWTAANEADYEELILNTNHNVLAMQTIEPGAAVDSPAWTDVDAEQFDELVLRVRSHDGEHNKAIYWTRQGEEFSQEQALGFRADGDGEFQTLVIPLHSHPGWSGQVDGLRLILNDDLPFEQGHSGWYDVDYIYFQNRTSQQTSSDTLGVVDQAAVEVFQLGDQTGFHGPTLIDANDGDLPRVKSNTGCAVTGRGAGEGPGAGWLLVVIGLALAIRPWRRSRLVPGSQNGYEDRRSEG